MIMIDHNRLLESDRYSFLGLRNEKYLFVVISVSFRFVTNRLFVNFPFKLFFSDFRLIDQIRS